MGAASFWLIVSTKHTRCEPQKKWTDIPTVSWKYYHLFKPTSSVSVMGLNCLQKWIPRISGFSTHESFSVEDHSLQSTKHFHVGGFPLILVESVSEGQIRYWKRRRLNPSESIYRQRKRQEEVPGPRGPLQIQTLRLAQLLPLTTLSVGRVLMEWERQTAKFSLWDEAER